MNWFKKAIAGVMSLGMMFTLVPVNADEEPARDLEAEKAAFLATLNADGYAEVGKYKVEKLTDNVYHMDEGTKALPGGAEDENGAMNNPSSIYFAVEDNDVLIVDLGNPATGDVELDAKVIVEAMTAGKNVTIALTHSHGDHTGLGRSTAIFENVNVTKLYVSNPDMAGSLRAAKQFEGVAVGLDDGESFEVAGKKYTMYIVPCHTAGSVMIENLTDNILYTGDTFGSGFVWALWGMNNGNPLAALDAGVARARTILNGMNSPRILAGHRWQQFWTENAQRPNEMSIQYFNDMGQVLTGLTNGSTLIEDYSAREGAVELSQPGCRAKVDTMPEYIDAYLIGLSTIDEAYIYNASNKLSIDSVNATAAPKFVIFPDGAVSDEEAQALIDDSGIVEYIDRSASSAYVVRPINGEKFTAEDVARFEAVVGDQIGLSNNFKLIGIGNGADFVANYLTDYFNFVSGLALINPTSAAEIKVSVPVFISGNAEAAAPYIKANKAQESGSEGTITRYVNPNSKYEVVVTDTAKLDGAAGIKEAWSEVLKYFGRIGNYTTEQKTVATWYSRPFLTGDKEYDTARRYQYFQSIDSIDDADMERTVVTEDLDGDGQLSLWYEYVPAKVKDASKGTVPVVFLMHGNTNDPRTQYDTAEWGHLAVEEGVILVAPEWQGHVYQGYSYQAMSGRREAGSDETYVISVLEKVLKKYPQADPSRVYMTGLSAGSMQTTTYGSTNPKYFAAGGGHSGPFSGNINSAQKYAKDYDFPIIYFTGDCDEYLMSSFDTATMTGAISCLNTFRILNDMEPLTQDDLKEELSDLYGVEWDEVYTIAPGAANIPEIAGGIMANDRGIEISFNRIRGWGHWNYSPDTYYMWNFMKKYARDLRTGASIRLDQDAEKGVVVAPNTDFPESDAPYQVTFTLDSVEAYDKVDLVGGFQFYTDEQAAALQDGSEPSPVSYDAYEYKEGMWPAGYDVSGIGNRAYPMENIGSKWTVTIPVPAGVWFYAFNVTPKGSGQTIKLLDPASDTPYNEANGHDNGWSLITIGNSDEHLPGQDWVFPEAEKKGTTEFVTYTAIDGTEQPLGVYLPPEYDASKKYPVVYVSHGGGGNEVEWHFLGATDTIMDNLIEAGLVEPTIVVTMDNTYFRWARDTVCNNVMDYIIPYIDANYSIDNVPERRAFCGLSMGGGTSNYMFLDHAGDFKYIGIWSGCYPNEDYSNVANKDYPSLMLGAGCIDMARPGFPILMEKLDEIGVYYEYTEAHGAHDWSVWRELFTTFAKDYLWKSADEKPAEGVVIAPNTDFPDVDVENQATFTFRAPEGTQSVALYGNFQYYDPADIA
ncbi:MAG: MBL fold metallo-hydrolase, partial [Solobacterium sp.]|nr:MBL fold metallo-hydrolase [Solobacterium sp.]